MTETVMLRNASHLPGCALQYKPKILPLSKCETKVPNLLYAAMHQELKFARNNLYTKRSTTFARATCIKNVLGFRTLCNVFGPRRLKSKQSLHAAAVCDWI